MDAGNIDAFGARSVGIDHGDLFNVNAIAVGSLGAAGDRPDPPETGFGMADPTVRRCQFPWPVRQFAVSQSGGRKALSRQINSQ